MHRILKEILKFGFGFMLAVLVSGFVYNYFPNFIKLAQETGFFFGALVNGTEQKVDDSSLQTEPVLPTITEIASTTTAVLSRNDGIVEISEQEKLDEIADQIDLLKRQINDLTAKNSKSEILNSKQIQNSNDKNSKLGDENSDKINQNENQNQLTETNQIVTNKYAIGGGTAKPIYPKILISEIQIDGSENDKQEFVELYNPNNVDVELTNWYLQRKTKNAGDFSTYVSSNLFSGKQILAKGYFLITRNVSFFNGFADILTENPLTEDNTLVLKNPNREIADLLGFGQAGDFEGNVAINSPPASGLSIGRKFVEDSEQDTNNNLADFEVQKLTPKMQNIKYVELPSPALPVDSEEPLISKEAFKILISEILLGDDEFIELYNPNDTDVNLTNWYLQRKTKTAIEYSSYVTKTQFDGKKIFANDYFLIARKNSQYESLADIVFDQALTADNSLVLKNFNGDVSDKLGFGQATDFELLATVTPQDGKSLARKFVDNIEQDTDNNFVDFEIKTPTPKAKNVEPEVITFEPPPVILEPPSTGIIDTTSPDSSPNVAKNIVINEIQTEGKTAKDEFIELYNPNNFDVDLAGFVLKKKTYGGTESNLVSTDKFIGTILAHSYFLIVPQDNSDGSKNYTGLAFPDLRYSGASYSVASNNTVLLYDKVGILQDKVGFGTTKDFEVALAENPPTSKSISRISGADTNDNSKDFVILDLPTPKAE